MERIISHRESSPQASMNSRKDIGYIFRRSTLPTGNDSDSAISIPRREPAQMTCCSGISSQKYFIAVSARGHVWTSSRTMSVLPGTILLPNAIPMFVMILLGSRSSPKRERRSFLLSRSRYASESNSRFPNSLSMYVLPH